MAFSSWDPWRDLLTVRERLDRVVDPETGGWHPPIDVYETADRYVVTAELPGMTPDQITVTVKDGRLTLVGRRGVPDSGSHQYHLLERGHGPFARVFSFAQPIDDGRIQAESRDGVLTITVPKAARPVHRVTVGTDE